MADLNIEELYDQFTTDEAIKEATAFGTIPSGAYTFLPDKVEPRLGDKPEIQSLFGRKYAHVSGSVVDNQGNKRGKQFIDISWEVWRVNPDDNKAVPEADAEPTWKMDRTSKLWGQYLKALDAQRESVGSVLKLLTQYPVTLYVTESFKTEEGWRSPRTPEDKKAYQESGYQPANFPQSISKAK